MRGDATRGDAGGYLLVMGLIVAVFCEKLGLQLLRTHWPNLDMLRAAALILTPLL